MNVHVPGEGIEVCSRVLRSTNLLIFPWFVQGYAWFVSIVGCLAAFAVVGAYSAYRFMVRRA